jgi:predicted nucleic acid-binding protein
MAVVDASVVVEYLAAGEHATQARIRMLGDRDGLSAPHLLDAEVGNALRRAVAAGVLSAVRAREALSELADLPIERADHAELLARAWALRANLSFYDALYVALAETLGEPLVTLDARLAGAPGNRATIDLIA